MYLTVQIKLIEVEKNKSKQMQPSHLKIGNLQHITDIFLVRYTFILASKTTQIFVFISEFLYSKPVVLCL